MVTHFFYDITHFDTNFFHTIHHLVFKPGFLSREYLAGRRVRYLHPIKMYVFTSAVFFLLFFSFFKPETKITDTKAVLGPTERLHYITNLEKTIKKDSSNELLKNKLKLVKDSAYQPTYRDQMDLNEGLDFISFGNKRYHSIPEYDSVQRTLPSSERDGWLEKRVKHRLIAINMKYREEPEKALEKLGDSVLHRLPYMLFVSLPLFALILKLVYIRRKQFYYADHGVFTLHLYIFSFILLLVVFSLTALQETKRWDWLGYIYGALLFWLFIYLYLAMRKFYGQGRGKTFLKFLLVAILSLLMMLVLLFFFMVFSAFTL
jgi:hypothetical protein